MKISGAAEIKLKNDMIDEKGIVIEDEPVSRKKPFSFNEVNIPIGSEIVFTRDENIKCIVVSNREIEYEGEIYSLSGLAKMLLNNMGYNWKSAHGQMYFTYNGKTLRQIRNDLLTDDEEE